SWSTTIYRLPGSRRRRRPFARWGDLGTSHCAAMGRTFLPTINPARINRSADDDRIFVGPRVLLRLGHIGRGRWNAETADDVLTGARCFRAHLSRSGGPAHAFGGASWNRVCWQDAAFWWSKTSH